MLNYACLLPVYISNMVDLKEKVRGTWYVIKHDNFSVNRSPVPFSLIGTDHGLEHQNHPVGVLRGIKGITNGLAAFDECFMITGEMFIS